MKQTTKNILGVGAIILLSSGVAGLTTYKLLQSNESAKETSFNEIWCFRLADGGNYDCMFSLEETREFQKISGK